MKFNAVRRTLACGVALGTFAIAAAAYAQDTVAPGVDEDPNVIIVTAERRSQNLQDVPVSVGVLGGEDLSDFTASGGDTLIALSGKVPSLYVESTTGRIFPRFYIRGLGNIDFYLGASQPVEVIQDDIVMEHVVLKSNPAFDIAQVEVLRGPQGSLFGRNTTAGIVKFDTVQPSDTYKSTATASYGRFNSINVETGVGGPLTEDGSLSFRLSSLYQHRDDWIDNTFTGVGADGTRGGKKVMGGFNERDMRGQLLFQKDGLTARVSAHYRDYDGTSTLFYRGSILKGTNKVPGGFDRSQIALDEAVNNPQAYRMGGGSLNLSYDFGGVTLTSISGYETAEGYSRGDTDGGAAVNFPVNGLPNGFGQSQGRLRDLDQLSQEVRLASADDTRFRWQVGGIYFESRDLTEFDQRAFFLLPPARNPNNYVLLKNDNTSWAVFGQASFDVTEQLTLTGGVRLTEDKRHTVLLRNARSATNVGTFPGDPDVALKDTKPSFDASVLFKAAPDVSLYARVARGFRGPTIQGRSAVFNAPFTTADSETNTSFEAGAKTTFLDGRGHFNLTGFYYEVKDIQLNGNDSNGSGVLFNADKATGYGLEAELDLVPVEGLTLRAGLSLLKTEIKDPDVFAQTCGLNGIQVCTVLDPFFTRGTGAGSTYFAQIDGNPLPNAPKYNVNVSARYDLPVGDGRAFVSTDWNVQGSTNFVLYSTEEFSAKGNFEGGVRAGYDFGNIEIAGYVRNVTNEKNLIGVIENYMAGVYNDPRTYGASISYRY